jgi:predicted acylesterase/phospholipase RssA
MTIMAKRRALCLAGGGVLGAAYEIGALAAVEDHFASASVHDEWDVFVGCSAGAVVASFLAQGVSARALYEYFAVADIGPSVLGERKFRINRFERALRRIYRDLGLSNRFADLPRTLLIPAVDVDDSEREVFGSRPSDPATVSEAVAASCAIPPVFSPLTIGHRRFVDGAFGSPLHVDLAVGAGATHILAVDPIAPVRRPSARRSNRGIVAQCQRIEHASRSMLALAYAKLMAPHVRTLLLRPARREMYAQNPMDWTAASELLRLGREQTARQLESEDVRRFLREAIGTRGSSRVGLAYRAAEAASA